jgi:hypothetical protein
MKARASLIQWTVLAVAGGASFYGASRIATLDIPEDAAEPVLRVAAAQTAVKVTATATDAGSTAASQRPTPLREAIEVGDAADTFRSRSWVPPPPPPPPPAPVVQAPPPAPTAPPLPFRLVGMLEDRSDQPTAFLAKGDALHVVRVGDQIDDTYRVESLSPTQVVMTYLPLKQRQVLTVAGADR